MLVLWTCAVLLAVRFFSSVALAAIGPAQPTLDAAGQVLGANEVVLAFLLFAGLLLWFPRERSRRDVAAWALLIVLYIAALAWWIDGLVRGAGGTTIGFAVLAIATVAAGTFASVLQAPPIRRLVRRWWGVAFLALLVLLPAILALRITALLGVGTSPGEGGLLEGNWALVYGPTLVLEFLAIGVWIFLALGLPRRVGRERWPAFLPFLAVLGVIALLIAQPFAAFILSATIAWGANLATFVANVAGFATTLASLAVSMFALACLASTALLVPRRDHRQAWNTLLVGGAVLLLAGFFPSMASVGGLVVGGLTIGRGLTLWNARSG